MGHWHAAFRRAQHAYKLTYTRAYMHACIHACMHTYIHTYTHIYTHTCIHAYIYTYIHIYIHTYIHTYIHILWHQKKSTRFQYQSMPAARFLSWFLDCQDGASEGGGAGQVSCAEYSEAILSSVVSSLAQLCKALRAVPVPQKWLGSSVALLFDAASLPAPAALEAAGPSSPPPPRSR
jgi:hypothetical protein